MSWRKAGLNAILKINPEKGPNDNFMQLVVKTRNNQGVAAKQVVCINYGADYDFTFTTDDTEKDVKIFRGALDNYFERAQNVPENDNQPPATPPKAAPSAPPKAKAPTAAPEPKAKAATAPAAHVEVPAAETKPKAPAAAPKASPAAEEPNPKAASAPPSVELAAGEKELCDDITCHGAKSGCKFVYTPGQGSAAGTFWFLGADAANKKIPPNTKLALIREGRLQITTDEGAVPYDMTSPKKTMVCVLQSSDRNDLSEPKLLEAVISEMRIKRVLLHDELPAPGACPAGGLTGKSGYAFLPTCDEVKKMVKDARALGQGKFLWAFKVNAKEALLSPYGVVLCTSKQALVTAKIRCALS